MLIFCGGLTTSTYIIIYFRTPHSSNAQVVERAMSVAWRPGIDIQAKMEYILCAVCNDIRLVLSGVGLGMRSQARFAVIHMDDAKLSPEWNMLTGFVSVLSINCICTGVGVYISGNGQFVIFLSQF